MVFKIRIWTVLCLAFVVVIVSALPPVEAGPLTRWKQRRTGNRTTNTHNVTEHAPPAPANLSVPAPVNIQNCIPGINCPGDVQQQLVPQIAMPSQPVTQMLLQPSTAPRVITREVAPKLVEKDTQPSVEDARVERLISALESRLGIKAQAAITGDPHSLFNKLPVVRIELKSQDGSTTDEVEIDLKMYLLEKLIE